MSENFIRESIDCAFLAYATCMDKNIKNQRNEKIRDLMMLLLGAFLFSFSINVFLSPRGIVVGGASGLATALGSVFDLPIGMLILLINLPLVIANAFVWGLSFTYRTLIGVVLTGVMTDLMSGIAPSESESLLCALLGGACMGAGVGIMFHSGVTTGGTDLAAFLLKRKFPQLSVARLILGVDAVIILLCCVLLSNFDGIIYSFIACIATSFSLDIAEGGLDSSKLMIVISPRALDIVAELSDRVRRGSTVFECRGGYTGEGKSAVLCVVKRPELYYARKAVKNIDPDAFIMVCDTMADGRGFEQKKTGSLQ